MTEQKQLFEAFLNKPSKYRVEVLNNEALPKELKKREAIYFNIKSPCLNVLTESALILLEIPEDIRKQLNDGNYPLEASLHIGKLAKMLALVSWGKVNGVPSWYEPFIMDNLTTRELYDIYYETTVKMNPSFFLHCFQIAEATNPLTTIKKPETSPSLSTPINS